MNMTYTKQFLIEEQTRLLKEQQTLLNQLRVETSDCKKAIQIIKQNILTLKNTEDLKQ